MGTTLQNTKSPKEEWIEGVNRSFPGQQVQKVPKCTQARLKPYTAGTVQAETFETYLRKLGEMAGWQGDPVKV